MTDLRSDDAAPPKVERVLFGLLLALLAAAPLALSTRSGVNETKWFIISTVAPTLCVVWIVRRARAGYLSVHWDLIAVSAFATLVTLCVSLFVATDSWLTWMDISKRVGVLATYILVAGLISSDKDRDRVLWAISLCGLATAIYGIAQHFGHDFFPWQQHWEVPVSRGVSFFGHATFAASYLIVAIPLTLGLAATRKAPIARILAMVSAVVMLYHLSFSAARGATASLFAAGVVVALIGLFRKEAREQSDSAGSSVGRPARGRAAIVLVLVLVLGIVLSVRAWRIKESDVLGMKQVGGSIRLYTWETAARMFIAHPLLGVGAGNYEIISPSIWNEMEADRMATISRISDEVHNEYLEVATEQGVLGLAAFSALLFFGFFASFQLSRSAQNRNDRRLGLAMFAALSAASFDALFIFNLQAAGSAFLFWTLLGLITYSAAAGNFRRNMVLHR